MNFVDMNFVFRQRVFPSNFEIQSMVEKCICFKTCPWELYFRGNPLKFLSYVDFKFAPYSIGTAAKLL